VQPEASSYAPGSTVELTAEAAAGFRFLHWEGDASGDTAVTSVVMDGNRAVTAVFGEAVLAGSLTVLIEPPNVHETARWSVDGGANWHAHGATVSSLPLGDHTVTFSAVGSYLRPGDTLVTLTEAQPHRELTGNYTPADTFGAWILAHAGVPEGQRGPADDPDRDGLANLIEYAYDLDPASPHHGPPPWTVTAVPGGVVLTTRLRERSDLSGWVDFAAEPHAGAWQPLPPAAVTLAPAPQTGWIDLTATWTGGPVLLRGRYSINEPR